MLIMFLFIEIELTKILVLSFPLTASKAFETVFFSRLNSYFLLVFRMLNPFWKLTYLVVFIGITVFLYKPRRMSTSPDNLDVICALLDGNDRIEYQEKLEQLKKESLEFWEFETVPYVFKQSATDTDDTKFDYLRDHFGKLKPWKEILDQLEKLNDDSGEDEVYKLAFLARHGQGYHNQAHAKYGNAAWNDYWCKINA